MIEGRFFDARSSASHPARVEIAEGALRLDCAAGRREARLDSVRISDRIGDIPRRITFHDGAVFETAANDAVDAALDAAGRRGFGRRVGRWERRWLVAVAALAAVFALSLAFVTFGMPLLAAWAARAIPPSVDARIGSESLEFLDHTLLGRSRLEPARQEALRLRLRRMTEGTGGQHAYRLEFRAGGKTIGPNAFALPSGIIVVTDEMVALAERDEEIDAVLAHEVGHVRGRHALRVLLQNAGVAALAVAVLGDVGSASSIAAAVPLLLVQAQHSRDLEREADAYARAWLRDHGLPQTHFDDMICRLAKGQEEDFPYLSTHPPLTERAACNGRDGARGGAAGSSPL